MLIKKQASWITAVCSPCCELLALLDGGLLCYRYVTQRSASVALVPLVGWNPAAGKDLRCLGNSQY